MAKTSSRPTVKSPTAVSVSEPKPFKPSKVTKKPRKKAATKTPVPKATEPPKIAGMRCLEGGPNGPPVYDDAGYLLSYQKCSDIMRGRRPKGSLPRGSPAYMEMLMQEGREEDRKCEIMGTPKDNVSGLTLSAWKDRVARELGIPYHKVEMKHYEILAERGFVGKEGEFEAENISQEERDRLLKLSTGSAFRA